MCTVTFIPVKEKIFITSNRDEKHWRLPAMGPSVYSMQSGRILFPRDANHGGTWFAVHENKNAVVFLNGAGKKHEPQPPYRKSRGLVLLDLTDNEQPLEGFRDIDLNNIEPFTAIIWQHNELFECRWDGVKKYQYRINKKLPHIWSSVTLYDEQTIAKRKSWFDEWVKQNPEPSQEDILHFHQFTGDGDLHNDLMMNRDNITFTVSITSAEFSDETISMKYIDIRNQQSYSETLKVSLGSTLTPSAQLRTQTA